MTKLEYIFLIMVACTSLKLAHMMGYYSAKANAEIEYLAKRYIADVQIAEWQNKRKIKHFKGPVF